MHVTSRGLVEWKQAMSLIRTLPAGPWCLYDCWGIDSSDPLVPVWFPPPGQTYPGTARDYVTGTCGNQYLVNGLDSLTECGYAQHGHDEKILGTYTTSFTADAKRVLPAVNVFNRSPPSSCTVATCASFPNKVVSLFVLFHSHMMKVKGNLGVISNKVCGCYFI